MSNEINPAQAEALRESWEYTVDEVRHRIRETQQDDDAVVRSEKAAIVNWLIRGYEERFTQTFPDALSPRQGDC